eukprot:gene18065-27828_t
MPSDVEEEQYCEIFNILDTDGRGNIGLAELAGFFASFADPPPQFQIEEIFMQCDETNSGRIDSEEFINVVETVKLLQNKTTEEIIAAFRSAKYSETFSLVANEANKETLSQAETRLLLEKIPRKDPASLSKALSVHCHGKDARVDLPAFAHIADAVSKRLTTSEVVAGLFKGLKALVDERGKGAANAARTLATTEPARKGGLIKADTPKDRHATDMGQKGCPNCATLKSAVKTTQMQLEADRVVARELRSKYDTVVTKLNTSEAMNKDLVFENQKLKRKVQDLLKHAKEAKDSHRHEHGSHHHSTHSALSAKNASFSSAPSDFTKYASSAAEDREERRNKLLNLQNDNHTLSNEVAELKKSLTKQKQEIGRQAAALALLHRHIASVEKENEAFKKDGDTDYTRELITREKALQQRLEDALNRIETLEQQRWFDEKLDYLNTQKDDVLRDRNRMINMAHAQSTEYSQSPMPMGPMPSPAASPASMNQNGSTASSANSVVNHPTSVPANNASSHLSPGAIAAAAFYRRRKQPDETLTVDPTDEEYRILTNFYHTYQNAGSLAMADDLVAACAEELAKVNTHHPAYWCGKNFSRIKIWMKQPVLSDAVAAARHKKKYIISNSQRSPSASHTYPSDVSSLHSPAVHSAPP